MRKSTWMVGIMLIAFLIGTISCTTEEEQAATPDSEFHEFMRFHDQVGDAWNMTIVVMRKENAEGPNEYFLRWLDTEGSLQFETELGVKSEMDPDDGLPRAEFVSVEDPSQSFVINGLYKRVVVGENGANQVELLDSPVGTNLVLYDGDGFIREAKAIEN